ncbi:ABC transporter permease [Limnoglobus roseus]|uniref:Autoinducer 2 import system permease protein LsrC n=2 Tax=Limnoglobus roseus TaxID=2598579 RepID=A0A5C1AAY7_9BACT|nr:ABC transporter permease [Limnoglobus roseus]
MLIVLAVATPGFFGSGNLRVLLVGFAPTLVAAVGMTFVIVARQIDISVGAQFAACAVVVALLVRVGWPLPLAALAAILTGAALGAINGLFVAHLRLPSIVVTLATFFVLKEGLRWWRQGELIRDLPAFQWFGLSQTAGVWVVVGIAGAVFAAAAGAARNLAAGRAVYATGSDEEAARLAGLRPNAVTFGVFAVAGALAGLAAVLEAVQLPFVDPKAGTGMEMRVIAAAVVGGAAVSGGRGTLVGTLLGVLLLGTIGSAIVFLRLEAQWEEAIQGGIILLAVASDVTARRNR